jgi:manganese transport protein
LAPALFAIALIAAGQSSTITGTLAGQIVMEGYLNLRISPWLRRLLTRLVAIIPALFTILFVGENKLGDLLVLSQVVLSMQLGFAVIPLIHFTSSKKLMAKFAIGNTLKILAWLSAIIIVSLNVKLVIEEIQSFFIYLENGFWWLKLLVLLAAAFAAVLLIFICVEPFLHPYTAEKNGVPHGKAISFTEVEKPQYRHIALTVDFSANDESTIQHALSMGGKQARYLLIHAVESAGALRMGEEILDNETRHDLLNLKAYQNRLVEMGYEVSIELGFGKSARAITDIINKNEIDLVVMAAHGHTGIKDFIFGSTVDKVRHAVRPAVFIVKSSS